MRTVAVVTTVALALSLSACGAGNDAPTRMITQVTDGVDGSITTYGNDIKVTSVLLVAQPDGSGVVVGTMVNENSTDDSLLAINVNGVNATLSQKSLLLKQNSPLHFAGDSANASAIVAGMNAAPGTRVKVKMFFASAGELDLDAIVREKSGVYAGVSS